MLNLSADELFALTGYRQKSKQVAWLRERLRIEAPLRADGLPIVSRAQVEAALASRQAAPAAPAPNAPRWKTPIPA